MTKATSVSAFLDRHKTLALVTGGFLSMTFGALYWLAEGGAVALVTSIRALSKPEIAATIDDWPQYHARVEGALSRVERQLDAHGTVLEDMAAAIDMLRVATEPVVEWSEDQSQRLSDAVGGCFAGQEDCPVYFRGRLTEAGADCRVETARARIYLQDGRDYPVRFTSGFDMLPMGDTFETLEVRIQIPDFIPAGYVGVVVLTVYSACGFAPAGEFVERETFRLQVKILDPV